MASPPPDTQFRKTDYPSTGLGTADALDQFFQPLNAFLKATRAALNGGLTPGQNSNAEEKTVKFTVPNVAASTENCSAVYSCSTNQAIPNSTNTVINFDTQTLDTDSAVTTGSAWVFTCPAGKAGIYLVSTTALISYQASQTLEQEIFVNKNGSPVFYGPRLATTTNAFAWLEAMSASPHVLLAPGDTVSVSYWQSSAAARALAGGTQHNWVAITRLNNLGATGPVVPTCFPLSVSTSIARPSAVTLVGLADATTGTNPVTVDAAGLTWNITTNGNVQILNIPGLIPGKTYQATLRIEGG